MSSGKNSKIKELKTYAFIDASNLFYGGSASLGWSIDYKKLFEYLKTRYNCKKIYYFGGIETHKYEYNYQANDTVPLVELLKYLRKVEKKNAERGISNKRIEKYIQRAKFYKKLQKFGYGLVLKPVKIFRGPKGKVRLKANCDLDMAFTIIKSMDKV